MDDLEKYIDKRKKNNPEFEKEFEQGYKIFKIRTLLRQAEKEADTPQEELPRRT